ncbi:unnamed protein product [Linum tenue]|uniref:Homeobox domain-containing protein n=1 Tax=Linum tenue TaxID=586396 RepID=A0AAV0JMG5_9ROSI|nr:unnamed protein product [Linum tenue]
MAENQSENPFFFTPPHQTRPKTNPPPFTHHNSFPITSPSLIHNSGAYNSHHHQQQQQHENGLSLSLSFAQQQHQQPVPLGPFTGYASVLNSSRFLRPAQLLLDELFGVNFDLPTAHFHGHASQSGPADEAILTPAEFAGLGDRMMMEFRWKDSRFMLMLDEVYRRYKLYCQQMQTAVASFEAVPGLGNAAPFIYYAIRLVSSHFTSLKNALLHQMRFLSRSSSSGCRSYSSDQHEHQHQEALQYQNHNNKPSTTFNLNFFLQSPPHPPLPSPPPPPPPVWRSQRGLPDHAVALLKSWLFEHFLHPYPTDSEKQILAQQTGLSRTQVSNWFINARVRVWKPMVEEIQLLDSVNKAAASSSSLSVQPPPAAGGSSSAAAANVGSKRSRNNQRQQRQVDVEDAGLVDCSSSDSVSLALGLPRTANSPVNNPSPWPFKVSTAANPSVEHHGFTGCGSSNRWYSQ